MGELKVIISDESEMKFRETAMRKYNYEKGGLSLAAERALLEWSEKEKEQVKEQENIGDPILAIKGMLKHVKKSSVELQHEISKKRGKS